MRKFYFVMAVFVLLQACSGTSLSESTATPTVTLTSTPTVTPTIKPSITPSATIVHIPTWDPFQATATFPIIPIFVNGLSATPIVTATKAPFSFGFLSILISEKKIFWGSCKFNKTKITANVLDPDDVDSVVIFVRTKAIKKDDSTPWTSGDVMTRHRNNSFSYTLVGANVEGHNHYKEAWVLFQLVATNDNGDIVGRSNIFDNSISLSPCT